MDSSQAVCASRNERSKSRFFSYNDITFKPRKRFHKKLIISHSAYHHIDAWSSLFGPGVGAHHNAPVLAAYGVGGTGQPFGRETGRTSNARPYDGASDQGIAPYAGEAGRVMSAQRAKKLPAEAGSFLQM